MENYSCVFSSYTTKYTIEYIIAFFNSTLNLNLTWKNPHQSLKAILTYSKANSDSELFNITIAIFSGLLGINTTERLLRSTHQNNAHFDMNLSNENSEIQLLHNYLIILCIDCLSCLFRQSLITHGLNLEEQLSIMLREKIIVEKQKEKEKHLYGYMYYLNSLFYLLNSNFFFIIAFLNKNNESYFIDFIQSFIDLSLLPSSQLCLKQLNPPKTLSQLKALSFNVLALININKTQLEEEIGPIINSTSFSQSIKNELIELKLNEIKHIESDQEDTRNEVDIKEDIIEEDITRPLASSTINNNQNETTNEETEDKTNKNNLVNDDGLYYQSHMINDVYFDFYDKLNEELKKQNDGFEVKLAKTVEELNIQHNRTIKKLEEEYDMKLQKEVYNLNKRIDKLTEMQNRSSGI